MSATAAYRHFVDRDDLVFCATGLAFEQFTDALTREVARAEDPFARLTAAGRAPNAVLVASISSSVADVVAGHRDLVQECLDAGAPAAARGTSADYLSFQMWTWIHGIVDLRITHPDTEFPDSEQMFADAQKLLGLDRPS